MSIPDYVGGAPQWDLADRLRKALRVGDVGVSEMAEHIGMSRKTVGDYLAGRGEPRIGVLRLWAMRCGVPLAWIIDGIEMPGDGPDGGGDLPVRPSAWDGVVVDLGTRRTGRTVLPAIAA